MDDKEIYREIKQSIASGDIASLPKEKLVQFQSALSQEANRHNLPYCLWRGFGVSY
jgi:hypothetical protein